MTPLEQTLAQNVGTLQSDDPRVVVGLGTYGKPKLMLWSEGERIEIGNFCSIADDVTIFGGGEHRMDWVSTYPMRIAFGEAGAGTDGHPANKGPTRIGHDVWLGYRAIVLSGVSIGSGSVVGAGAVVANNVPPYSVVAGNPARIIRRRFTEVQIEALLAIEWWNWPIDKILKQISLLSSPEVDKFIGQARPGNV
ncbi:CatB-related O-acetyltransferase [Cupriavidus basilensis]|uniref:CatB-related O-acetyltransferase n=1 Tax=Cupriavidus basilensis TaxID=68895 RepID=UPI0023E8F72E|nr:CatB-related O-acetyltransferase [Cupriavidus basilensis]MDF3886548.1 CatB-related O-acetyltransferase [Cupriavidus basilensis]